MYVDQGHKVTTSLKAAGISASSFYYQSRGGRVGKHPSMYTRKLDGELVTNDVVVSEIRSLLNHEFVDYGYIKVAHWLRKRRGYLINKKKVFRLMRENKLLNAKQKIQRAPRLWVEELVPQPDGVFEHLEIDIKYIHIHGTRRNIMQLSVLDVKSRYVLGYVQRMSIKQQDVIRLFKKIFSIIAFPKSYFIRCDNGSQFVAIEVRKYFNQCSGAHQEFTRPCTPEQNGHIEAFHSIIQRTLCQRFQFDDFEDLKSVMARFIAFYNTDRIHSGIGYECPLFEIRKTRPAFKAVWIVDYPNDNPLLSYQDEGLALGEDTVSTQLKYSNNHKRILSS